MRAVTCLSLLAFPAAALAVPLQFSHQGRLLDAAGAPLEGEHAVGFALYDTPSGGAPLWSETQTLTLELGFYGTRLGTSTPLDASAFDGATLYLGLEVDGGAELPSRLALVSVPYAISAGSLGSDATIDYGQIAGAPSVTLDDLSCATAQVPVYDGAGWTCGDALEAHVHDAGDITSGALDAARLPIGTSEGTVAAGDHAHGDLAGRIDALEGALDVSGTDLTLQGGLTLGKASGSSCTDGTLQYDDALQVCIGGTWETITIEKIGGSSAKPGTHCKAILDAGASHGDGLYWIDPNGGGVGDAYQVYCDMTVAGGGWTLALNLDTSDGHVMWWANPLWESADTYGEVGSPFVGDHKSQAFVDLSGTTGILLAIHEQGSPVGWKAFAKSGTGTLRSYMQGGDNQVIGGSVTGSDTSDIWANERLVRTSTTLRVNYCVNGSCTDSSGGSPDGDRFGSPQSGPSNNDGGGLGNWHDMGYCCSGKSYDNKTCNGSAFRTTSEAQTGWVYSGQYGTFGTDSFGPMTGVQNDSVCGNAAWAKPSGVAYDYAVYVR